MYVFGNVDKHNLGLLTMVKLPYQSLVWTDTGVDTWQMDVTSMHRVCRKHCDWLVWSVFKTSYFTKCYKSRMTQCVVSNRYWMGTIRNCIVIQCFSIVSASAAQQPLTDLNSGDITKSSKQKSCITVVMLLLCIMLRQMHWLLPSVLMSNLVLWWFQITMFWDVNIVMPTSKHILLLPIHLTSATKEDVRLKWCH